MKSSSRIASFIQLRELFQEAEAAAANQAAHAGAAAPAKAHTGGDGSSGWRSSGGGEQAGVESPRTQHDNLQPPAPMPAERPVLKHPSMQLHLPPGLPQQHSLGLLDRRGLGTVTHLQVGLPGRGGSKTFSIGSLGSMSLSSQQMESVLAGTPEPRALRPYGKALAALLQRRCRKACRMLAALQKPKYSARRGIDPAPPLPAAALRFCKGLAFVKQYKAGLVAGWNWGDAMVVARLPDGSWSAPCFLTLRFASVGVTAGMCRLWSVYVLQSAEQVAAFARNSGTCTVDAAVPAELDPFDLTTSAKCIKQVHEDLSMPLLVDKPHRATVADGIIWDISVRAGVTLINDCLHAQLYGHDVTPGDILHGRVASPPELQPLFADIDQRSAAAQVVRPTVSKYTLVRQQSLAGSSLGSRKASLRKQSSITLETPTQTADASSGGAAHASPRHSLAGSIKLFGDVGDIGFVEEHSYVQQEAEELEEQRQQEDQQQRRQLSECSEACCSGHAAAMHPSDSSDSPASSSPGGVPANHKLSGCPELPGCAQQAAPGGAQLVAPTSDAIPPLPCLAAV